MNRLTDKLFYIDPDDGLQVSYSEFAIDIGLAEDSHRRDLLPGNPPQCNEMPDGDATPGGDAKPDGQEAPGQAVGIQNDEDRVSIYRVFSSLARAVVHNASIELSGNRSEDQPPTSEGRRRRVGVDTPCHSGSQRNPDTGCDLSEMLKCSTAKIGIRTSGTTGRAKLIWHRMDSLTRAVRVGPKHSDDVWGFAYEPTAFAGVQVFLQALANRNTIVRLYGLEPELVRKAIATHRVTHLSATPTFIKMLCGNNVSLPSVKRVTLGGEQVDSATEAAIATTFPDAIVRNVYASTEVGTILSGVGDSFQVPSRLNGKVVVREGELFVATELLAESLKSDDGFFATGDMVEVLSDSPLRFRFAGRRGDWINVGGQKVNPHRVEAQIAGLDDVQAVRVFGVPNSVVGNLVACEIVLAKWATINEAELRHQLESRLSRYEMPQIVNFVRQMNLTGSGKKKRS